MVLKYMAKYCITITNTYICRKHTTGWITVVQFPGGAGTFLVYATTSRPALGPSQPPNQGVPGVLSTAVKQPEHKADHHYLLLLLLRSMHVLYLHPSIPLHGMVFS